MRANRGAGTRCIVTSAAVILIAGIAVGCGQVSRTPPAQVPDGNPVRGRHLIAVYGCGACHEVPGVTGAAGLVGPPLTHFGRRGYIAGELANTGDNLQRWIRNPQDVEPGTAMPNLHVTPIDARDIAAYLFTLR